MWRAFVCGVRGLKSTPNCARSSFAVAFAVVFLALATVAKADFHAVWKADTQGNLASSDLWTVMRERYDLPSCQGHDQAEKWARWYANNPAYLSRIWERAQPLMFLILEQLAARNLPAELALLPVVESAFQPYAYSHGRAAGLWQFVPGTGKDYGLKQNWWYDGRRDIVASTQAAAAYLADLHRAFDGDWLLALAAYNSGQGRVAREIKRNRRQGKGESFWELSLPTETSSYVPKLLGIACVVKNPADYDLALPAMRYEPVLQLVDTAGQIDLAMAAQLAGMDLEALYKLNPAFNRWASDPRGPHRLLLPADNASRLSEALEGVPVADRIQWQRHKIQPGQTLSHLASKFDVTVAILREANQLRPSSVIRAGDYLMVPQAAGQPADYVMSETQRLARLRAASGASAEHTVQPGDSLWTLARRFDVGVRQLAKWNGMAPGDTLSVGKTLVIKTVAASAGDGAIMGKSRHRTIRYRIRKGDSLWRVASRFRVRVSDITRWNGLSRDAVLQPGQTLKLVVDVTAQS